jgi:hypothetical protein
VLALPTGTDGDRCGVRLEPVTPEATAQWLEVADSLLYPSTDRGGENYKALWDLYERSGYFRLSGKSPAWFEARRDSFESAAQRLVHAPEMGCHAVWSSGEHAEAVVSALRIYSETFFPSQMAKSPGPEIAGVPRRTVLRDIQLHAYEHAYHEPSCRWVLTYVHEHARFNMLMWKDFTDRYHGTANGWVSVAHAIEVSCGSRPRPLPPDLVVSRATGSDTRMLLDTIAATCPTPYVQALDLSPDRFDLSEFKAACEKAGFFRDRAVLVARRLGEPVAAAVLDTATDGLHLFGLLDTVRMFPLARGDDHEAYRALLDTARGVYGSIGKAHFVAMCDGPWSPRIEVGEDMSDLGEANLTIISADIMPEWLEYMHESLAPRPTEGSRPGQERRRP